MIEYFLTGIMNGDHNECHRLISVYPEIMEDVERLGLTEIINKVLDKKVSVSQGRNVILSTIGIHTDLGKRLSSLYSIRKSNGKKHTQLSVTLPAETIELLTEIKLNGGNKSQLVAVALDKLFSEVGTNVDDLIQCVKSWHGIKWNELVLKNKQTMLFKKYKVDNEWITDEKREEIYQTLLKKEEEAAKRKERAIKSGKKAKKPKKIPKNDEETRSSSTFSMEKMKEMAQTEEGIRVLSEELGLSSDFIDKLIMEDEDE